MNISSIIKQCSSFCKSFQLAFKRQIDTVKRISFATKLTESQIADSDGVHTQLNLIILTRSNIVSAPAHDLNKINFSVH